MQELLRFLASYEIGIYVIFVAVILFNLKGVIEGFFALRKASFRLEKEVALKKLRSSLTVISLFTLLGISVFVLLSVASVRVPGISRIATPTLDVLASPVPAEGSNGATEETRQVEMQTQTAIALTGCIPGQLEWIDPAPGVEVSGSVELRGTVNVPNLGFFKYEYRNLADELWTPISAGNRPIIEDLFAGRWNTAQLEPGNYALRLVVSDNQNNLLKPCVIEVRVLPE
ncbi:MAG: hypothetical protein FJZ98_03075 [Chloroflexi bacterium]|nr:hypothetical protein [Chloroflexota bacterium]